MILLALGLAACEQNLDIPKHGNIGGMDVFYKTDNDALQAAAAIYAAWSEGYFNWYMLKNALSDDVWCGGQNRGDNAETHYLNEYTFGTEHGMVEGVYTSLYSIIYNANLVLDNLPDDSDVKRRVIAEAKFFRAWAHFELVTLWGNAPAVDHVLLPSEYRMFNSAPATTWALIEQDLTEAINSGTLPSKTGKDDSETGIRITKETAQAYLGKAYVFQEKWADAISTLDLVINSGKYDLYRGDYGDVLRMTTNNGCESILETQVRFDPSNPTFSMVPIMVGWRFDQLDLNGLEPAYSDLATDAGYGFFSPTKALYDAFVAHEGADGTRLNQTMKTHDQLKNDMGIGVGSGKALHGNEGYFFWKNRILKSESVIEITGFRIFQGSNYRVMRYAEVLLLAAEAHVKGGGSQAANYINEVRSRAGLSPKSSVTMDDVKTEKRLELCAESVRFQDLVRWGDAPAVLGEQGKEVRQFNGTNATVEYTNTVYGFKTGKHELLPIPGKEIALNPNIDQNPKW
ncbi:MAG: RagB/SusD family nutrient uptake outer membrane protein [Prevotellaceae bacterium]|nr:RagB/SusD family nutrient uptake outer membrane protein [Prevotellaceae bacterium]